MSEFELISEVPDWLVNAIALGLPLDQERMSQAREAHDFYGLEGRKHLRPSKLDDPMQFADREVILLPVVRAIVDALTKQLYPTEPARTFSDPLVGAWIDAIYAEVQINDLMEVADRYALLDGATALHVYPGPNGIDITLYAGDEFAPIFAPNDKLNPAAIITLDQAPGEELVYQAWTPDLYLEATRKDNKACLREVTANPYGVIPFVFGHASRPIRSFWEGRIGPYLATNNRAIDAKSADTNLAEGLSTPIMFMPNASAGTAFRASPGEANPLPSGDLPVWLSSGYNPLSGIETLKEWLYTFAGMFGVPRSELEASTEAAGDSGIAILMRRLPLKELAKKRMPRWSRTERELARLCYYMGLVTGELAGLTDFANARRQANSLDVALDWNSNLAILTPDRRVMDQTEIEMGISSTASILMRDKGLTREQAHEYLDQIATDNQRMGALINVRLSEPGSESNAEPTPGPGRYDIATHLPGGTGEGTGGA